MPTMYRSADEDRFKPDSAGASSEPYRNAWRRDYARIIHCAAWRRLQGKTQLFPGSENDFFRTRLTHSLEVAQIAKSITIRLNATEKFLEPVEMQISPEITEIAGLCHDLGHPPFGHNGEKALSELMGDRGGFEGNAQTLRILTRLEKKTHDSIESDVLGIDQHGKDQRRGLNLTFRSIASCLKYDKAIPANTNKQIVKGYYSTEKGLVGKVKDKVGTNPPAKFKTIECSIMDVADDIAYSTYDLEDAFKGGFLSPLDAVASDTSLRETIASEVTRDLGCKIDADAVAGVLADTFSSVLFDNGERYAYPALVHRASGLLCANGFVRTKFTSDLVSRFIAAVKLVPNESHPWLSQVSLGEEVAVQVEVLKKLAFHSLIRSPRLHIVAYRGKEIVAEIFTALADGQLLPDDWRALYRAVADVPGAQERVVCDFVAGMTDRYAIEFYARLKSENPQTIFKPL